MKLKSTHIKAFRDQLLVKQKGKCALCNLPIKDGDAALDHDHQAPGSIRAVLHRFCNSMLGKLENHKLRTGMPDEQFNGFLKGVQKFLSKDYSNNPIHPLSKTEDEKELKKLLKAQKSARKASTKAQKSAMIKVLQEKIKQETEYWEE